MSDTTQNFNDNLVNMSEEICDDIYVHYIKTDKLFRNYMRSREVFNLIAGKTKKYCLNGMLSYFDFVSIVSEKINATDTSLMVLERFIKKYRIYRSRRLEMSEYSETENDLDFCESYNKLRFNKKYEAYIKYDNYYDTFEELLRIPKSFADKNFYKHNLNSEDRCYFYLKDYFKRFNMFVNEIWEDAVKDSDYNLDELATPEIKLLYAVVRGAISTDAGYSSVKSYKQLNRLFGLKQPEDSYKEIKDVYLKLLKALNLNYYIENCKKDYSSLPSSVYDEMYFYFIGNHANTLKKIKVREIEYKLEYSSNGTRIDSYTNMYDILKEALSCLLTLTNN